MFKKILDKIIAYNENLTVRVRLIALAVVGLALTMAFWGLIQLTVLDKILVDQQVKRLEDVADTVSTFYQYFPSKRGLLALDSALKDYLQADVRLARIDIFDVGRTNVDYVAGASRIPYEWTDNVVADANKKRKSHYAKISTEGGPALGLLYPVSEEIKDSPIVIGIIGFSRANAEIMNRAQQLLIVSSVGLLIFILLFLGLSYGWMIGKPLKLIIEIIDEFQKGRYKNRIPIVHNDEWGQIAEHFNTMADEIQRVMSKNLDLTKHLEDRVREETSKGVQLQKQVDELQQLTALGHLAANLAHDLGTPIHSIGGLAKLLLEKEDFPKDVSHKLQLIVQQTQRLDDVIQNVRKATRLPEPRFELIAVQQLLSETLPLVEPLLIKNKIEINVGFHTSMEPVYVDRYRIQTVLLNIIQNSLEAMPQGGKITVSAETHVKSGFAAITIQDTGTGMSPDTIQKACEPFFSTRQDGVMRGLGLAIVRDIIKLHGGKMEIKSSPGQGTSIILYLPISDTKKRSS
jgi:two-component system, NtrC family, sensor kinase